MKRYETIFIIQADLPDEDINTTIDRYQGIVADLKGTVINVERWGKRKMAYPIEGKTRGFYTLFDYAGQSKVVFELERNFKIDDKVLKYMTIMKSDKINWEQIEKERAAAEAKHKESSVDEVSPGPIVAASKPEESSSLEKPIDAETTPEAAETVVKEGGGER
jgi:small subunit ribosomal protein S6